MTGFPGGVRWGRHTRAIGLALALFLAACNGGSGSSADETLPPADTTSSSTTSPSTTSTTISYAIPATIDAAYVEKVMKALDHVYGDAIRVMARDRSLNEAFLKPLVAIYSPRQFRLVQDLWVRDLREGLKGLLAVPGDPTTRVQRVLRADANCVLVAVERDFGPTHDRPDEASPQEYIGLIPKSPGLDPTSLNPTPWIISFDGYISEPAGAIPETPCDSSNS